MNMGKPCLSGSKLFLSRDVRSFQDTNDSSRGNFSRKIFQYLPMRQCRDVLLISGKWKLGGFRNRFNHSMNNDLRIGLRNV